MYHLFKVQQKDGSYKYYKGDRCSVENEISEVAFKLLAVNYYDSIKY